PDGEDIRDILSGTSRPRQNPLFWEWKCNVFGNDDYHPPELAIRDGDWKLFMNPDESVIALYNLAVDPAECDNVADEHPEIVARLKTQLADWKATLPDGYQYNE
ncbi:MAG: N-acetylgalactosamine 6-sulfate sulfatase (GALNS), partial [Planctomycetes bacterium]|nr:N-acetylgalactosamine 6-sulfate sulfatase (GALNS) [Planctomycetota bacterium]